MVLTIPKLLLDERKCKENISRMATKAKSSNVELCPHFKTHQSVEIGEWFKEFGVTKITVSSVTMAEYFAEAWRDITIAFPVNILEIETINKLAGRVSLTLLAENLDSIIALRDYLTSPVAIYIKVDVGYHRAGVTPSNTQLIDEILDEIARSPLVSFKGFLGHAGHTYKCRGGVGIEEIHKKSLEIMANLKEAYSNRYPELTVSLGDTPSCSLMDDFSGVDEIRPGNFVFYDLAQNQIGSNTLSQIAVAIACPIVAIHERRLECLVYGGGVHFSKDRLEAEEGTVWGRIVEKQEDGWGDVIEGVYMKGLSQEHGTVAGPQHFINQCKVGDYLLVLPVHSCMASYAMKGYHTLDGRYISRLN